MMMKTKKEVIERVGEPAKKDYKAGDTMNVAVSGNSSALQAEVLISRAIDKGVPVDVMERLLAMRRELKAEYAKEAFDRSMSALQSECPTIEKTKKVMNKDHRTVRYAYAPIENIVEQVRPFLKLHGFSYTIDAPVDQNSVTAICKVTHSEGHSETSSFKIPIDKESYMNEAQKFASALTFAKRYAFCNAFGILTGDEDNDSNSVEPKKEKTIFEIAQDMISNSEHRELIEFKNNIGRSKRYTSPEKKVLSELVEKRLEIIASSIPTVESESAL